jgi:hypothetical protein
VREESVRTATIGRPGEDLSPSDRLLLLIPLAGGIAFGVLPYLAPALLAQLSGYPAEDLYVARIGGAATFGYAVALALGIRDAQWRPLRPVVVGVLVFNLVSLYACIAEVVAGRAQPMVYVIGVTSAAIAGITANQLRAYPAVRGPRDVAGWVIAVLVGALLAATVFGLLALVPQLSAAPTGYRGTVEFLFRQTAAATLGYAAMGVIELRSLNWRDMRLPFAMALVFNLLSCIASVVEVAVAPTAVAALIAVASGAFSLLLGLALFRSGR